MDCDIKEEEIDPLRTESEPDEFDLLEETEEIEPLTAKEEKDPLEITEVSFEQITDEIVESPGPSRSKGVVLPLRRSQRRKSVPVRDGERRDEKPKRSAPWTKVEKAQLLEGLKIAGDSNISDLVKFVPTKSPFQIEYFINCLKRRSSKIIEKDEKYFLLDLWSKKIKHLSKKVDRFNYDSVPIGLLLISLIEDFPSPQQANGVNFRELYEYLFCLMSELPLPKLDRKTKRFLHHSLQEVESDIKNQSSSLLNAMLDNNDLSDWPFNCNVMNPLYFPRIELNLEDE